MDRCFTRRRLRDVQDDLCGKKKKKWQKMEDKISLGEIVALTREM